MRYLLFFSLFMLLSCSSSKKELTAQAIIDKGIQVSGADLVSNATIRFDFRKNHYVAFRKEGKFSLEREMMVDSVSIKDILDNSGFKRLVNGKPVEVIDSIARNYANAVNSVHYFSVLPFGLNDAAVKKKLLPETTINGKAYYKIQISFGQENGGTDFEDVFIYWVNKNTFFIDYLAYEFHVNGGGIRFRELKEQCTVNGIRFVDYNNYKAKDNTIKLANLDMAYQNKELVKVSEIILKNIQVEF